MKIRLLIFALLLAFAVPAGACTLTWTNAVGNGSWSVAGNWLDATEPPCEPAHAPVTGDTVQFLDGTKTLPSLGLPNAAEVFVLVLDGASAGTAWDQKALTAFCGALNWAYSSLTVGGAGRPGDFINLDRDSAVAGTITAYGWALNDAISTPIANATITVKSGGHLECLTTNWTITQTITVESGGWIWVSGSPAGPTLFANGGVNLAGTIYFAGAGCVLDVGTAPINCTGDCAIEWNGGEGIINGGLNAGAFVVTHTDTAAGNSITCDVAGTLDLGTTTANALAVTVTAATTIGNSFACGSLAHSAGAMTGAAKTITAPGGYTMSGTASIAGTLTVNLSGGAGAYTQTAGTIADGGVLNVTTGSGGFSAAALTLTGTGAVNITQAVSSSTIAWNIVSYASLTVNSGVTATLSGAVKIRKCTNNGAIVAGGELFYVFPAANDFWSGSGTYAGTAPTSGFQLAASYSNAAPIVWGSTTPCQISASVSGSTLTASGGFTCGNIVLIASNTAGHWAGLTLPSGASLSCANLVLSVAASDRSGKVVLGTGVHRITGTISNPGSVQVSALTLGGRVLLGGTFTGTGIVVTPTYEGQIDCFGVGRVTAVTSTGRRLVVRRAVNAAGMPLRSFNADSCVNVRFLGRKEIGAPGVQ